MQTQKLLAPFLPLGLSVAWPIVTASTFMALLKQLDYLGKGPGGQCNKYFNTFEVFDKKF